MGGVRLDRCGRFGRAEPVPAPAAAAASPCALCGERAPAIAGLGPGGRVLAGARVGAGVDAVRVVSPAAGIHVHAVVARLHRRRQRAHVFASRALPDAVAQARLSLALPRQRRVLVVFRVSQSLCRQLALRRRQRVEPWPVHADLLPRLCDRFAGRPEHRRVPRYVPPVVSRSRRVCPPQTGDGHGRGLRVAAFVHGRVGGVGTLAVLFLRLRLARTPGRRRCPVPSRRAARAFR